MDVLDNVLKIVKTPEDLARAHYMLAMGFYHQGGQWDQMERIPEEFEAALKIGKRSAWYDAALFNYAQWLESSGRRTRLPDGQWQQEPDFSRALEMYRRILKEFKKGESRFYAQAQEQIGGITAASVAVQVSNFYLPDSEIQAYLSWHNQKRIELAIYALDVTADVALTKKQDSSEWLQSVNLSGLKPVKTWTKTVEKGEYQPGSETLHLDSKLEPGAYVIEASGQGGKSRDLILVTDATLVLKTSGRRVLAFFCNVQDGAPIPQASIKLWMRAYVSGEYVWKTQGRTTNQDGLAVFELETGMNSGEIFAGARACKQQAFALSEAYGNNSEESESWRIYADTDRAAYRPGDTVRWKMVARAYQKGTYTTPADQPVEYEITDPQGAKVKSDKLKLNLFGSAWADLALPAELPLGEYHIAFYTPAKQRALGSAMLFRLEEYKLPEFKVAVQTPEENGKKKAYRIGELVEATVQADYYFGGPVANATVEVVVYQNPYFHYWLLEHDYPWFYADMNQPANYWGQGQIIKRETLKTDAQGRAQVFNNQGAIQVRLDFLQFGHNPQIQACGKSRSGFQKAGIKQLQVGAQQPVPVEQVQLVRTRQHSQQIAFCRHFAACFGSVDQIKPAGVIVKQVTAQGETVAQGLRIGQRAESIVHQPAVKGGADVLLAGIIQTSRVPARGAGFLVGNCRVGAAHAFGPGAVAQF